MTSLPSSNDHTIRQKTDTSRPPLKLIYTSQGFCGPYPDYSSDQNTPERISKDGSSPVVKLDSNLVVKYGAHVQATEAENLLFIEQKAPNIPAPRVSAYYTIGPIDRDPGDFGSVYDTYIIMSFVEGDCLDEAWSHLNESQKMSIATQLRTHIQQIRSLSQDAGSVIGSITNRPLQDPIFANHSSQGPFTSEQDFNAALVSLHEKVMSKAHARKLIEGALAQNRHKIVLTHGDLQGRNIMVSGDRLTGIIDWETCGWYPEYWEFAKCFCVGGWPEDWAEFVLQILEPYYCQWVVFDMIERHVW